MEMSPDEHAAALATTQASALSRTQALALGLSDRMIATRLRRGRWLHLHPGVYAIAGAPPSWEQRLWGAALAVGPAAIVSHETALLVGGLDDRHVPRHPVMLSVPRGRHHRVRGAIVHQIGDLAAHHVQMVGGLRVSLPARAIVDLAGTVGPRRLGELVDLATDRLTSTARIATCMAELARPGKPGLRRLGEVLDERGPGHIPPQSELEARLFDALAIARLPAPRRQFPLPGRGVVEGLVDAAYPGARLIVEADGRRWHTRIRHLVRDHDRDAEAARVGWQTLRFLYERITETPQEVAATVADVLRARLVQQPRRAA
jgi:very-short-patch-repair endonuclease